MNLQGMFYVAGQALKGAVLFTTEPSGLLVFFWVFLAFSPKLIKSTFLKLNIYSAYVPDMIFFQFKYAIV